MGMLRTKTEEGIKLQKRQIVEVAQKGKDDLSRIYTEQVINNTELVHAIDIVQLFCEKLQARLDVIDISGNCCPPDDMLECVHSLLWASPRLSQIQELSTIRLQLTYKYKKEYVDPIVLKGSPYVNQMLEHKLTVKQPEPFVVQKFLSDIVGPALANEIFCSGDAQSSGYSTSASSPYATEASTAYNSGYATPVTPQEISFPSVSSTPSSNQSESSYSSYTSHVSLPPPPYPDNVPPNLGGSSSTAPASPPPSNFGGPSPGGPPSPFLNFGETGPKEEPKKPADNNANFDFDDLTARFEALKHKR
eukprot:TRINITY_DN1326_c0_g1_i2.p1 TRINITY_DN1326_c0_g1~~TRINITY_DN1326_c0_g1_i2.p1  ORF type:complete len:305 (+),score=61.94 TRINITY_DN1326_c0_g1_i2:269-1183(+)